MISIHGFRQHISRRSVANGSPFVRESVLIGSINISPSDRIGPCRRGSSGRGRTPFAYAAKTLAGYYSAGAASDGLVPIGSVTTIPQLGGPAISQVAPPPLCQPRCPLTLGPHARTPSPHTTANSQRHATVHRRAGRSAADFLVASFTRAVSDPTRSPPFLLVPVCLSWNGTMASENFVAY